MEGLIFSLGRAYGGPNTLNSVVGGELCPPSVQSQFSQANSMPKMPMQIIGG